MQLKNQFKTIKPEKVVEEEVVEEVVHEEIQPDLLNVLPKKTPDEQDLMTSRNRNVKDLHNHNGTNSELVSVKNLSEFIETSEAAPSTEKPRRFWEQFKIFAGSLYFYSNKDDSWSTGGGSFDTGTLTKSANFGTGTEVITCNFQPSLIVFETYCTDGNGSWGTGVYDRGNATQSSVRMNKAADNSTDAAVDATYSIRVSTEAEAADTQGSITATSSTSFTITWNTDDAAFHMIWKAFK